MIDHPAGDPFADDDAAYLLGALDPPARRAFEAHLSTCPSCTERVDALRPTLVALASVTDADLAGLDGPVAVIDPRQPHRARWAVSALGAVAAAALIALAVVLGTRTGGSTPPPTAAGRLMSAVGAAAPIRATAQLSGETWGTRIVLDCRYLGGSSAGAYPAGNTTYLLEVLERDGSRHDLGSWALPASGDIQFVSGIAVPAAQIRAVQITLPDGTPVLQLVSG